MNPNDWLAGFVGFFQPDGMGWGVFNLIILILAIGLIIGWVVIEIKPIIRWVKLLRVRWPFYLNHPGKEPMIDKNRIEYNKLSEQLANCLENEENHKRICAGLSHQVEEYMAAQDIDRSRFKELLIVSNERLAYPCNLSDVTGGELHFEFDVFNGSLLGVDVGYAAEGYLSINILTIHDKLEPLTCVSIPHGDKKTVSIKQYVSPKLAEWIHSNADKHSYDEGFEVCLNFGGVQIMVKESQSGRLAGYLKLTDTMRYVIKSDHHGFYDWQPICQNAK